MSESINELRQQVAVLEERMNTAKAENESAMERLRTDMARDAAERSQDAKERAQRDKYLMASVYGVGIAILAALSPLNPFGDEGRQSASPPAPVSAAAPAPAPALASPLVVINLPPGAQMPAVQGAEVQVVAPPAPPAAAPPSQPGETAGK